MFVKISIEHYSVVISINQVLPEKKYYYINNICLQKIL